MLRWRISLGVLIVAGLAGLCWVDHVGEVRHWSWPAGIWLIGVAAVLAVMASHEVLVLASATGLRPVPWVVYGGNLLLIAGAWVPYAFGRGAGGPQGVGYGTWPLFALAAGVILVLLAEMARYETPGGVTANIAAALFALVYIGVMLGFAVAVRMTWGVGALAALVICTKMGDTGAYAVGRLFGRHKMAPVLSPGKTIEGALGALAFACLGSWVAFHGLIPRMQQEGATAEPWLNCILFGVLVGTAGLLGDLAESLLKRDAGLKDSSRWVPGFGGVLDLLDSILVAAPIAWLCWACGLVGR